MINLTKLKHNNIIDNLMVRIGVVLPTFTSASYGAISSPNYYDWYVKYMDKNSTEVTSDLDDLTVIVPITDTELTAPKALYIPAALNMYKHLKTTRPSTDSITTLTDIDLHNGAQINYDILLIFHEEYVTQQLYQNLQSFVVNQGGVLVAMDGNVFFAKVDYNESTNTTTLVSGHYWQQIKNHNGQRAAVAGPGEHWLNITKQWFGSNSDAAPSITQFAYLVTTLEYNLFGYPTPPNMSGVENQYRSSPNDVVLVDYNASVTPSDWYLGPISTYYLDSGNGRSLVFGLFTDVIQTNPVFLSFFDKIFQKYAVERSTATFTENPGPTVPSIRHPPPKMSSGLKLENKIRKKMGLPEISDIN